MLDEARLIGLICTIGDGEPGKPGSVDPAVRHRSACSALRNIEEAITAALGFAANQNHASKHSPRRPRS